MAKKLGKFLLGAAALGGAAAAVLYYLQNREQTADEEMDDFEDLDDFDAAFDKAEEEEEDDDMDAADMGERSYVPLDYGKDAPQADATVPKTPAPGVSKSVPDVEEFFDDEDSSMDAM